MERAVKHERGLGDKNGEWRAAPSHMAAAMAIVQSFPSIISRSNFVSNFNVALKTKKT